MLAEESAVVRHCWWAGSAGVIRERQSINPPMLDNIPLKCCMSSFPLSCCHQCCSGNLILGACIQQTALHTRDRTAVSWASSCLPPSKTTAIIVVIFPKRQRWLQCNSSYSEMKRALPCSSAGQSPCCFVVIVCSPRWFALHGQTVPHTSVWQQKQDLPCIPSSATEVPWCS